jgi:5'(3')-deoxyribonucleotidase
MVLYIDMDGVIADFDKGVKAIEPDVIWDQENVDRVCEGNCRIFKTLPEIEGAIDAVNELRDFEEDGLEIYFLSTPMQNVPESYMDKRLWLKEKFGDWANKRLILTHRKDLNKGDFLIDDRLTNGSENFSGKHIHFGTYTFPDWKSVLNYLKSEEAWT